MEMERALVWKVAADADVEFQRVQELDCLQDEDLAWNLIGRRYCFCLVLELALVAREAEELVQSTEELNLASFKSRSSNVEKINENACVLVDFGRHEDQKVEVKQSKMLDSSLGLLYLRSVERVMGSS